MTNINITDTAKLGTLSTQILSILQEEGYHPTKFADSLITFEVAGQTYALYLEPDLNGLIYINFFTKYISPFSLSTDDTFTIFNNINHHTRIVNISFYPENTSNIQISADYYINETKDFTILFHRAFSLLQEAEKELKRLTAKAIKKCPF